MNSDNSISEISFCLYSSSDHESFVGCINSFFKGAYPYTQYMDDSFIIQEIAAGRLIMTLAKDSSGKVVGTAAAKIATGSFRSTVELFLRCVSPEVQGKKIGTLQENYLLQQVENTFASIRCIFAEVVTNDTRSQITLFRHGYSLCGMGLMLFKSDVLMPLLPFPAGTKMTMAYYVRAASKQAVRLCALREHQKEVIDIYSRLGVRCSFDPLIPAKAPIAPEIKAFSAHAMAEAYIHSPEEEEAFSILPKLAALLKDGYTATVFVNMCSPGFNRIYSALAWMGFIFTGIKPLQAQGEYMVMSNIQNSTCGFESIILPPEEKDFLNYIIGGKQ